MKKAVLLILCFISCKQFVYAQLCTGSLGDPIVNITFGNSKTGVGPLAPGVTNMTYTSQSCPNDGSYTITNATSFCFNDTWLTVTSDHTGDAGGRFMLVNASITPNDFYVETVNGLCGNTTYEFAAWVTSVLRPSACSFQGTKPNLTFRIETTTGTVLLKYDSGDIPNLNQPAWRQYGTFFKTPIGVSSVVLRITNNSPGGCGNDLALDDITFRPCGPLITTGIRNQAATSVDICQNNTAPIILDASTTVSFTGSTIQWQVSKDSGTTWTDITGAQSASYTRQPTTPGMYQYRVVSADAANFSSLQCRVISTIVTINVYPAPVLVPKTFVLGCTSTDLQLVTAQGSSFAYQWSGPNNFSSTIYNPLLPQVVYADSGLYRVIITTPQNCNAIDTFNVKIFQGVSASVTGNTVICDGTGVMLVASGATIYSWLPTSGLSNAKIANPIATPKDTTQYTVTVTNQFGCQDTAQTTVYVIQNPVVNAGPDKAIFEGQSVMLDGSISGNVSSFYWSPLTAMINSNTVTPTVSPADSITYTLFVLPGGGCPAVSDNVFVRVYKHIFIPNVFSPNGDGINDTWVIRGLETYPDAILQVFTRTGQPIFQSRANNPVWDGTYHNKPVPVATYYYVIDLKMNTAPLSGWVVILR